MQALEQVSTDRQENYAIPKYTQAAAALLRLATPFFYRLERDPILPSVNFDNWKTLRLTARLLTERGAMMLTATERCALRATLEMCPSGGDVAFLMGETFEERA